jgi:hypothetical protein
MVEVREEHHRVVDVRVQQHELLDRPDEVDVRPLLVLGDDRAVVEHDGDRVLSRVRIDPVVVAADVEVRRGGGAVRVVGLLIRPAILVRRTPAQVEELAGFVSDDPVGDAGDALPCVDNELQVSADASGDPRPPRGGEDHERCRADQQCQAAHSSVIHASPLI